MMSDAYPPAKSAPAHLVRRMLSSNFFLFFLFAAGFMLWRHGQPVVWDDTSVYKIAFQSWKVGGREDWLATFLSYIVPAFSEVAPSGYRPVGSLLQSLFILTIDSTFPSWGHLFFVACFVGGLAVAFRSVAARFIKSKPMIYVCLVLFMFSSPMAQSSWITYSGIPVLVPFFTCIGLIVYFEICDQPTEGWGKFWLLFFIVIIAAWYREFMIALPLTILGMETIRARRITRVSLVAGVLVLLCLFPTAVPYLFYHLLSAIAGPGKFPGDTGWLAHGVSLPVKPVFQLGNVDAQLSGALVIREEVSRHLLNIPSPSLLILTFFLFVSLTLVRVRRWIGIEAWKFKPVVALVAGLTALVVGLTVLAEMAWSQVNLWWPLFPLWSYHLSVLIFMLGLVSLVLVKVRGWIGVDEMMPEGGADFVVGLAALVIGLAALTGMNLPGANTLWPLFYLWSYHLGVLTLLLIAWIVDRRLAIWTAVFLAPFYLVYTERVHLAYVMMPLSIVVAALLEQCWAARQFSAGLRKLMRFTAGIAIAVGVLDAGANPVAVQSVMTSISSGIEIVAHEFNTRTSDRPVAIIGNALHVDDLGLYLNGSYRILWTVGSGHDRPQDTVETSGQLSKLLKDKLPTTDVYFLDISQDYLPAKKNYHQHRFVAGCSVSIDDLGSLHLTRVEYFMPDPLRWFGSREYFAFFGPPDLVDDFYYGPSPRRFFGKVEAEYHLYKVTSSEVKNWLPLGMASLIDGNYFGFSVVSQNGRFFAIPIREGEFFYERVCRRLYSKSFESSNLDEIRAMVRGLRVAR